MATAGHARYATNPKSAEDWHIQFVYNDPEFIEAIAALREVERDGSATADELQELRQEVADLFAVSIGDINLYMLPLYVENRKRKTAVSFNPRTKRFSISFEPTTTRAELLDEWKQFEKLRGELFPLPPTKRKSPEQPNLLYAIFKARQQKLTFKEIFRRYSDGELHGYSGSATQFTSEDSLETYYNKFKPTG